MVSKGEGGGGVIILAGSSRRASKPPFWRIFSARSGRRAFQPLFEAARKNDEVGIPVEKTRKPPSLPASILANFPARSGLGPRAYQSLFDAAGKYDEVGIPKKNAEKSLWANAPDGTWCHQALGRPTTLAGRAWWQVCMNTVSKKKYRETRLLYKNQNISQSFGLLAGLYMIVTNSQFCTGV